MSEALPARPHLDWYRKSAKEKLLAMRSRDPGARLADAQFAVAREHGFASWRQLKVRIDELRLHLPELFDAIGANDPERIRRLLVSHPQLARVADAQGQTALHVASERNNPDAVELLLAGGAQSDTFFGNSAHNALSWALTTRAFEAAAALIRKGVQPDFFCAAGMGDVARVRSFFDESGKLRAGASRTGSSRFAPDGSRLPRPPTDQRELVSDALYFAARNGHAAVVRELLLHDADLGFRAFLDGTPLHWAYWSGERDVVDILLQAGADPALRDSMVRCTPRPFGICVAANWGILGLVRKQIENDATLINVLDGRGAPLHEAARGGSVAVVEFLLEHGADAALRDHDGRTALDIATGSGRDAVRDILSSHQTSHRSTR